MQSAKCGLQPRMTLLKTLTPHPTLASWTEQFSFPHTMPEIRSSLTPWYAASCRPNLGTVKVISSLRHYPTIIYEIICIKYSNFILWLRLREGRKKKPRGKETWNEMARKEEEVLTRMRENKTEILTSKISSLTVNFLQCNGTYWNDKCEVIPPKNYYGQRHPIEKSELCTSLRSSGDTSIPGLCACLPSTLVKKQLGKRCCSSYLYNYGPWPVHLPRRRWRQAHSTIESSIILCPQFPCLQGAWGGGQTTALKDLAGLEQAGVWINKGPCSIISSDVLARR